MVFRVYVKWKKQDEFEVAFNSATFSEQVNGPGTLSISMPESELSGLIPSMAIRITEYDINIFSGRLGILTDESVESIKFDGVDEMGTLTDRVIEYSSADEESPATVPFRKNSMEISAFIKKLFQRFTGETATDSKYGITKYITESAVIQNWQFAGSQIPTLLKTLAETASISTTNIGFAIFIDADKEVHFQIIGSGKLHKNTGLKLLNFTLNSNDVINSVSFFGGLPSTKPSDRDFYTDSEITVDAPSNTWLGTIDATKAWHFAKNTASGWASEVCATGPSGGTLDLEYSSMDGVQGQGSIRVSIDIQDDGAGYAYFQFHFNFNGIPAGIEDFNDNYDWSDGEGDSQAPAVRRPYITEDAAVQGTEGNLILAYVTFYVKWSHNADGSGFVDWTLSSDQIPPQVYLWLVTNGGQTGWWYQGTGDPPIEWIPLSSNDANMFNGTGKVIGTVKNAHGWQRMRYYPRVDPTNQTNVDITDVEGITFMYEQISDDLPHIGAGAATIYLWIDNLTFHFYDIKAKQMNTQSINKYGIRQKTIQDRAILDWKTGHSIAKGVLDQFKDLQILGDNELPFNSNMKLNDVVETKYRQRNYNLVIRKRHVTIGKNEAKMTLSVGSSVPSFPGIISAFHVTELKQQAKASGYKLAESWTSNTCFEICEDFCEIDCLIDQNQTSSGILIDEGVDVEDPCLENCETYTEIEE